MAVGDKPFGLREVRALPPGGELRDGGPGAVSGFGARRQKGDAVTYFVTYRKHGRLRRYTIGKHGAPWTPETARKEALRILGLVAAGEDPAAEKREERAAETVAELCDLYMQAAESGRLLTRRRRPKKPSTLAVDRSRIESHVKPLLGHLKARAVTRRDIERFMHQVAEGRSARRAKLAKPRAVSRVTGGQGVASRTIGMLGAIFEYAVRQGITDGNPVRGVVRPADGQRDRRLSDAEYAALGRALAALEADMWPPALASVRFLALTGWRSGEATALRWQDIDLARRTARLPDTKTGASLRALSAPACDLLRTLGPGEGAKLVFPPSRGEAVMTLKSFWRRIHKAAGLPPDVTPHTLRHSFASVAADLGMSELTIAGLLGHRLGSVTGRYVHSADAVLIAAADRVAGAIARKLAGEPAAEVVPLPGAGARPVAGDVT
jgi:integrase